MNNSKVNQLHKLLIEQSVGEQSDMKKRLIKQRFNNISLCCNKEQTIFFDVKTCTLWMISGDNQNDCEQAWIFLAWSFAKGSEINSFAKLPFAKQENRQLINILKIIEDSQKAKTQSSIYTEGSWFSLRHQSNQQSNGFLKESLTDQLKRNHYEIMVNYYFRNKLDEFIDWAIDEDLELYDVNDLDKNLLKVKSNISLFSLYKDIDYNRCRLPDIFEYIEMFYNSKRRHGFNDHRSPVEYKKIHQKMAMSV